MRVFAGFLFLTVAASAADTIHPLDVKPGMWESSITINIGGAPPVPPDVLARMTPQQRAMVEGRLKSLSEKPTVTRRCMTREDLQKPLDFGSARQSCKRSIVSSSASKMEIQVDCEMNGMKTTGTVRVEALDSEHLKITSHATSGDSAKPMTVDANGTAKWVSAACSEEPAK